MADITGSHGNCICVNIHFQIIAEFERILGLNSTSVVDKFKHNFSQVAEPILQLASKVKQQSKKEKVDTYLDLLEGEFEEDNDIECTPGKNINAVQYWQ